MVRIKLLSGRFQNEVFRRAVCRNKMQASGFEMNVSGPDSSRPLQRSVRQFAWRSNPEKDTEKIQALGYSSS
jgi:hypothetical protein